MEPGSNNQDYAALDSSLEAETPASPVAPTPPEQPKNHFWDSRRFQLAGVAVVVIVIALIGVVIGLSKAKKPSTTIVVNTQNLDAGALTRLESQNQSGTLTQQLTITPDTLFKNNVNVQGNLTVNGTSHLQSAVSLANSLSVSGPLTVGNSTTIGGNLSVNGLITAGGLSVGSLTITSLHTTGDLTFGGHLITTGLTPSAQAGPNAGSGATVIISGSDTSGTVTINTGNGPLAGQLATITFKTAFKLAPHVQLTPINADSATVEYYVVRSAGFFTINTAAAPKAGTAYSFDYLVSQ